MKIEVKYKDVFIQDVKVGDFVKSFNVDSAKVRHNRVGNTILPIVEKNRQIKVECYDGSIVVTSTTHPMCYFDTVSNKWLYKNTGELEVDDILKSQDSETKVMNTVIGLDEDEQFYDITVERDNNFFAGEESDKMVVVHNSATLYFPWWHKEIEDVLVLKNNKGTDDNRVRHMDYGIQFEKLFYSRLISGEDISLFSPSDTPGLYESFGLPEFEETYVKYEKDKTIPRKTIKSRDLMGEFAKERVGTGRMYVMNIDNANINSPFIEKMKMSNLCLEILLPTSPIETIYDVDNNIDTEEKSDGEIALCTLAAFNLGNIKSFTELHKVAEYIVRILEYVVENQDYPINAAKKMLKRRSIGVGVTNFAYWLAKQGVKYSEKEALFYVDELFENIQYSLLKASNKLAQELGPCEWFDRTTYSKGILPIDRYNKNVDSLIKRDRTCDWEALRSDIQNHGLRNSVLTAIMPSESSSVVQNATNGIEPIRSLVTTKKSKSGLVKQVAPECIKLKNKYELAFEMPDNRGYTNICAVIQKWIDQSISANHYYQYSSDGISISTITKDILYSYKYGLKTLYYANTDDKKSDDMDSMGCDSGACSI